MVSEEYNPTDFYLDQLVGFDLYDSSLEQFFLKNYLYKRVYHCDEELLEYDRYGATAVAYLHKGRLKVYTISLGGRDIFNGYIPQYSTLATMDNMFTVGKRVIADEECSVYVVKQDDYLEFLQKSKATIMHQLREPYARRNINDFIRNDTQMYPARVKVAEFVLCVALRFGVRNEKGCFVMEHPPTILDISSYVGIHRNNVSRFLHELEGKGLVEYSRSQLVLLDADALAHALMDMKQAK